MRKHWHILDPNCPKEQLMEVFGAYQQQLCLYLQTVSMKGYRISGCKWDLLSGKVLGSCWKRGKSWLISSCLILFRVWRMFRLSNLLLKITEIHTKKKKCWKYWLLKAIRSVRIRQWKEKIISLATETLNLVVRSWRVWTRRKKVNRRHKGNYLYHNWSWLSREWEKDDPSYTKITKTQ